MTNNTIVTAHFSILDDTFRNMLNNILEITIMSGARNGTINTVKVLADAVCRSYIEACENNYEQEAKQGLFEIMRQYISIYTKVDNIKYTSVVWPSIFTSRIAEILNDDILNEAMLNSTVYDVYEDVFSKFSEFYNNFSEYCLSGGKKGHSEGSNNSVIYKTFVDKMDYTIPEDLKKLSEEFNFKMGVIKND